MKISKRGLSAPQFVGLLGKLPTVLQLKHFAAGLMVGLLLGLLSGCSTALNYKLPPWEVKRQELTCDRTTKGLPSGLVCVCRQYGSTWDCQVARVE